MEPELEGRYNAEIPATATQRPEEFRVFLDACRKLLAVSCHKLHGDKVVTSQTILTCQNSNASSERETPNPCMGNNPSRGRQSMGLSCAIEVS